MKQINFESIDSTNTYLKNNYKELDDFTFVSAKIQTQGRGRCNRKWDSENSNLLFSLLLKNERYFAITNSISIISAYTVLQVLQDCGLKDLSIKWPNDVYVKDKKICGILLEATSLEEMECLIIGVGLNVNQEVFDFSYNAISMKNILNIDIDIDELKNKLYKKFEDNLYQLLNGYDFYMDIVSYDYLKNKQVYALINNQKRLVKVKGINRDYSLCVTDNDKNYSINSGEISFHI